MKKYTEDDARDIAISIVVELLDNYPYLLSQSTIEIDGEYTDDTFELQDVITEIITKRITK